MPITAAEIEDNGWVLRLTLSASAGGFGSYALDPNGSPRLVLASSHAGFVRSNGQAVAGVLARQLVATRPLRRPIDPAAPTLRVIDETDLGGGSIRVRLALSEHVYAGDTALVLTALAGWRAGEAAANIPVSNGSTLAAPLPIMRWALPPYGVTTGSIRVALVVASHHPRGLDPVAAVRFTATDGSSSRSLWVAAQSIDPSLGDNLNCYTGVIDAAGLSAGLIRVDAEIYPWLGAMRTTDPAGTRTMANLRTAALSVDAAAPWVIGLDPVGSRYGQMWAYVDPVSGTTTPAAAMVQPSLAAARALAPGSRPRSVDVAIQAGYLANRTLPAANGQASQTRSIDGMQIVLAPGIHVWGTQAVTSGLSTPEIPVVVTGDPDDGNPRVNCVFNLTAAIPAIRASRLVWRQLTVGLGVQAIGSSAQQLLGYDRVTLQGRAGLESNSAVTSFAPAAGQWNVYYIGCRYWRFGAGMASASCRNGLVRACEHSRTAQALAYIRNRFIDSGEDGFVAATAIAAHAPWPGPTLAGQAEDIIIAHNDVRRSLGALTGAANLPAVTAGTPNPSTRRWAIFGNLCERRGSLDAPFWQFGEGALLTFSYNIIEFNSFVGDRVNGPYNQPPVFIVTVRGDTGVAGGAIQAVAHGFGNGDRITYYTSGGAPAITGLAAGSTYYVVGAAADSFQLATAPGGAPLTIGAIASTISGQNFGNNTRTEAASNQNQIVCNRVANNFFDLLPSKQDQFLNPIVQPLRANSGLAAEVARTGYLGHLTEGYSFLYGVGHSANVIVNRLGFANEWNAEFPGLRSLAIGIDGNGGSDPAFVAERSRATPADSSGGGDYRPLPASPLVGRGSDGNGDRDLAGTRRPLPVTAGALLAVAAPVAPDGARQPHRAGTAGLAPALAPGAARLPLAAAGARLAWQAALAAGSSRHGQLATPARLAVAIAAGRASHRVGDGGTAIATATMTLLPLRSGLALADAGEPLLLPAGLAQRRLTIGAEIRRLTPERD